MHRIKKISALFAIALLAACAPGTGSGKLDGRDMVTVVTESGETVAEFSVESVFTPKEQAIGLQGHEELRKNEGMLFVFKGDGDHQFWNRGVSFPIDIVFANRDGTVATIHKNVPTCPMEQEDCPLYGSDQKTQFVLELPAGTADEYHFEPGHKLVSPAMQL